MFDSGKSLSYLHSAQFGERSPVAEAPDTELAEFRVLGPLDMSYGGRDCTPSAPKVRQVLALLVLQANQVVYTDTLVQELWGENPPPSALTTIQTYIYHLRRLIERDDEAAEGSQMLVTRSPGYSLRVRPYQIDLVRFQRLSQSGRNHLNAGQPAEAAADLRAAMALCTGGPLANVNVGSPLGAYVTQLREHQMTTLQLRIEAEMQLGMHRELLGELRSLVAAHPFDEWLHGQLIRALDRSGRRSDALDVYRRLRANLDEELGLNPSPTMEDLHYQVLTATVPNPWAQVAGR